MLTKEELELKHKEKDGLEEAIKYEILPALIECNIGEGLGSGFFFGNKWFISNAHVISNTNLIENAKFYNFDRKQINKAITRSFIRPYGNNNSPDLVTARFGKENENFSAVDIPYKYFTGDKDYGKYSFYIEPNYKDNTYKIRYLKQVSENNQCPILYAPLTDSDDPPLEGSSGMPIVEARIISDRTKGYKWQFKFDNVLYARCYDENQEKWFVCAIPASQDIELVYQLMQAYDGLDLSKFMSDLCPENKNQEKFNEYQGWIEHYQKEINKNELILKNGISSLKFLELDNIEKLIYDKKKAKKEGIKHSKIKDSLLIKTTLISFLKSHKVFDKYKEYDWFKNICNKDLNENNLQKCFDELLEKIKSQENHFFSKKEDPYDNFEHFRVDVDFSGTSKKYEKMFQVHIQDNTGKHTVKIKNSTQSISTTFATAIVPAEISGEDLADLLLSSYNASKSIIYDPNNKKIKKEGNNKEEIGKKKQEKNERSIKFYKKIEINPDDYEDVKSNKNINNIDDDIDYEISDEDNKFFNKSKNDSLSNKAVQNINVFNDNSSENKNNQNNLSNKSTTGKKYDLSSLREDYDDNNMQNKKN